MMAPTRHQETGPAAASSHAALSHSSGCDRDGGSRERERGRPLKRQQRWHRGLLGTRARAGEAFLLGKKVAQDFLANGEETLSPPLFPTSVLLTPAISSSSVSPNTCPSVARWGLPTKGCPLQQRGERTPWRKGEKRVHLAISSQEKEEPKE